MFPPHSCSWGGVRGRGVFSVHVQLETGFRPRRVYSTRVHRQGRGAQGPGLVERNTAAISKRPHGSQREAALSCGSPWALLGLLPTYRRIKADSAHRGGATRAQVTGAESTGSGFTPWLVPFLMFKSPAGREQRRALEIDTRGRSTRRQDPGAGEGGEGMPGMLQEPAAGAGGRVLERPPAQDILESQAGGRKEQGPEKGLEGQAGPRLGGTCLNVSGDR